MLSKNQRSLVTVGVISTLAVATLISVFAVRQRQETQSQGFNPEGQQTALNPVASDSLGEPASLQRPALYLGFTVEPVDDKQIAEVVKLSENKTSIINAFVQWGNPYNSRFTPEFFQVFQRRNVTPMITWEPWEPGAGAVQPRYTLASISAGDHDDYIRESARAISRANMPVFIRFAHEMNGNWYPWSGTVNGNSPAEYRAAWQRVVSIFRSENVQNVTWVWSPNADNVPADPLNNLGEYYPGDEYVDWVALDGYNWGVVQPATGWRSFDQIFRSPYDTLVNLTTKPIMIAEISSTELGGQKDQWLKEMLEGSLATSYPQVRAIVFFNLNKETDWRMQSSPTALTQFMDSLALLPIAQTVTVTNTKIVEPLDMNQ